MRRKIDNWEQLEHEFFNHFSNTRLVIGKAVSFHDSDITKILEELLKFKLIQLPDMKQLEETDQVNDPNYCKYHRLVDHPIEKCFVLKDRIMGLYKDGKIEFKKNMVSANVASITNMLSQPNVLSMTIKLGSSNIMLTSNVSPSLEEMNLLTIDKLKEVNIGTTKEPHPTFISSSLSPEEKKSYFDLLTKYRHVFTWTYKEMPRLDPKAVVHHLIVKKGVLPIKQAQQRFYPNLIPQIEVDRASSTVDFHYAIFKFCTLSAFKST
ncbi:Uncharacterized protein TCM_040805 [Theobroma cacao]|uniref:Retrotransposon gag protein n=1 Tax=Theobroma cacao TaxID=3641 RepID=A0A061GSI1_THECC|nr:Uncharacterized protein TCM_040805 [Theobroma cacao]